MLTVMIGAAAWVVELFEGELVPVSELHADRDRTQIAKATTKSFFIVFSFPCCSCNIIRTIRVKLHYRECTRLQAGKHRSEEVLCLAIKKEAI